MCNTAPPPAPPPQHYPQPTLFTPHFKTKLPEVSERLYFRKKKKKRKKKKSTSGRRFANRALGDESGLEQDAESTFSAGIKGMPGGVNILPEVALSGSPLACNEVAERTFGTILGQAELS